MNMKRCSKCKIEKPTSEFNKYSKSKDELRYWCQLCDINSNSTWLENNKQHYNQYKRENS